MDLAMDRKLRKTLKNQPPACARACARARKYLNRFVLGKLSGTGTGRGL
jgi:hypothetical protein